MMKKTAIVTGGAGGIGQVLCTGLLADGWQVAAFDRDEAALAALPEPVQRVACDVGDEASVKAGMAALGWDGLDLLVNNAGLAGPHLGPVEDLSLEAWRAMLDSHLTGAFLMTRACVPLLRPREGAIVNMASTRAMMSEPDSEAYAAAKGGLVAMGHALAISLGPEIRVNTIAPGWIVTSGAEELSHEDHAQHPVGRAGRPEDVLEAVRYLAQPDGFVTGQVVTVDGGMTRKMIYAE
ncbi:SDR family oxidoreductase [Pseudoroseicyclus aestuarii]|uniref:NAD(P)-dependent dehydrogenase (Short-subunit alcohol dehydrogenase family) n=1 Tax=Pseudoroseicyclus aestuarii TaxID=1795041 RepID=A0A318STQ8_9RHOB|nr:SDR family oxidoreductase [Pseudoroseicyclus aestuarii]PYE83759.1 NAD(P)-dependent dehydrogenase (short-subunit alcohol dehydrogenase family) [Pseudoroseicyclus aestuarii]